MKLFDGVDDSPDLKTIAHELGHGAFNLEHPWEDDNLSGLQERQTQSIMDYGGGEVFFKHECLPREMRSIFHWGDLPPSNS